MKKIDNKILKILWFTNTPLLYDSGKHVYYGGGWIESFEEIMQQQKDIELEDTTNYLI